MTADLPQLIFLAGVPASGKTHFGDWMHTEHKAVHLNFDDSELRERLAGGGLAQGDFAPLAAKLRADASTTVVSWGYPANLLWIPPAFAKAGFELWWFEAPEGAARTAFQIRGTGALWDFNSQMGAIVRQRRATHEVFAPNIIETLAGDGVRLPPAAILQRMTEIRSRR